MPRFCGVFFCLAGVCGIHFFTNFRHALATDLRKRVNRGKLVPTSQLVSNRAKNQRGNKCQ